MAADLDGVPPTVTMAVIPGAPLGCGPTGQQFDALEQALRELWSVPADDLLPRRPPLAYLVYGRSLLEAAGRSAGGIEAGAYDAALAW